MVELIFLALLLVTNFLLYLGAVRRSTTELLAWLVSHAIFGVIQVILVVYFIVVIFIIVSPHSQVETLSWSLVNCLIYIFALTSFLKLVNKNDPHIDIFVFRTLGSGCQRAWPPTPLSFSRRSDITWGPW